MADLRLHSTRCVLGSTPSTLRVAPARVIVEDGWIRSVQEGVERPDSTDTALGGQLLAPAFVNAHTHLALHACRGLSSPTDLRGNLVEDLFFRVEAHLEPADVEAFARVAALECLLHGVGTVFDHYYHGPATARAARDCGLAAVVAPTLQDHAAPGVGGAEAALGDVEALDTPQFRAEGIVAAVGPHATDTVSAGLWRRALDLARTRGLVAHAHVAQSADEARRSLGTRDCSPLEWMQREGLLPGDVPQLLVHALFVDESDLGRLDPASQVLCANPYSQMQFGFPAPVGEWTRAGLDWFVGTDCGASNDSMDVQKELRLLSGQATWAVTWSPARRAMRERLDAGSVDAVEACRQESTGQALRDPRELLHRVWGAPGQWVPRFSTGVIAPGARAQLLVFDVDHPAFWPGADLLRGLALGGIGAALSGVIAAGRWVGEPGRPVACLTDPTVRAWIEEATRRHAELLGRAGIR